jgi:hypothetical protein
MDQIRQQAIAQFVRLTLGCQCPEEVFRSVTLDAGMSSDGSTPFRRLAIGARLLIYVFQPPPEKRLEPLVEELATRGRSERDRAGYNRFRLVVASDDAQSAAAAVERFQQLVGADTRAHVHVVPPGELPRPIR